MRAQVSGAEDLSAGRPFKCCALPQSELTVSRRTAARRPITRKPQPREDSEAYEPLHRLAATIDFPPSHRRPLSVRHPLLPLAHAQQQLLTPSSRLAAASKGERATLVPTAALLRSAVALSPSLHLAVSSRGRCSSDTFHSRLPSAPWPASLSAQSASPPLQCSPLPGVVP